MKKKLNTVTLLGVDCIDIDRLILASEICQKNFEFADVKLLTSIKNDSYKNIIPIKPIASASEYSRFIITELDGYIDTPHVLIIQYDGFILNPDAWNEEFLEYDYIGAPWLVADWSVKDFDFPEHLLGKFVVGNGGFSLRTKKLTSLLSQMSKDGIFKRYDPEDVAICVYNRERIENHGIKFAPIEIAKQFSFEDEDDKNNTWNGQFGFHGLRWTDISKWLKEHPEYNIENNLSK